MGRVIYLLLRLIVRAPEKCLAMMEKMRPLMHDESMRKTRPRHLHSKADCIYEEPGSYEQLQIHIT